MTCTPAQLRHACALVSWSPRMVVWNAKTSYESAHKICAGYETATVPEDHLQAIQSALEAAGIEFISDDGGAGVRLRKAAP